MLKEKIQRLLKKSFSTRPTVTISYGQRLVVPVFGEYWGQGKSQDTLKRLYAKREYHVFSLEPPVEYQKIRKWPEPPFANVVEEGFAVSKNSWVGYIQPKRYEFEDEKDKERRRYVAKLVRLALVCNVQVTGKILKEGQEYNVLLKCSRKEIDEAYKKYVTASRSD